MTLAVSKSPYVLTNRNGQFYTKLLRDEKLNQLQLS